ncbi:MAG: NAD(P)-binding protein, partial [Pseudomonadota bacterium]
MLDTADSMAIAASAWFATLGEATTPSMVQDLFLEDSYWRDAVGLGPGLETISGRAPISEGLSAALSASGDFKFSVDPTVLPQWVTRVEIETLEVFFAFETDTGRGRGILRLCPDQDGALKAWTLLTALEEIKGHEEMSGANRPTGQSHSRDFRGPNWLDQRRVAEAYADRDPTVLVVGGGQAGLAIAARLTQLGVDTLIVDKNARIGDNWRNRYHALTLHNQVQVNHLPYMPFPPSWPTYIPKDKLANWFEAYVDAMELNFWTGTELTAGQY